MGDSEDNSPSNKATISLSIDPLVASKSLKYLKKKGVSRSYYVNEVLKRFIQKEELNLPHIQEEKKQHEKEEEQDGIIKQEEEEGRRVHEAGNNGDSRTGSPDIGGDGRRAEEPKDRENGDNRSERGTNRSSYFG